MSNNPTDLFNSMVKEAMEEVGNHGWREASNNAVTLAAFGMMADKVNKRLTSITKPAWLIACSAAGAVIWFIISSIIGV